MLPLPLDSESIIESRRILGGAGALSAHRLRHSSRTGVTKGVWEVNGAGGGRVVLKVLSPGAGDPGWRGSHDETHLRYWRREALVYQAGLPDEFGDAGIRLPHLRGLFHRPDGDIALWVEALHPDSEWTLDRYHEVGRRLGRAQGTLTDPSRWPAHRWLTRDFLPRYLEAAEPVPWHLLDEEAVWEVPLIADCVPRDLARRIRRIRDDAGRLLPLMAGLPRTLSHLDVWPANLFWADEYLVPIDWAFFGVGAIGEDAGNLILDSGFDLLQPASRLPRIEEAVVSGYLTGLGEADWDGDPAIVQIAVWAAGIKFAWLLPVMLEKAAAGTGSVGYGGTIEDEHHLYRERVAALSHLADRADRLRSDLSW